MRQIVEIGQNHGLYPTRLKQLHTPPKTLYCIGDLSLLSEPMVGVVGSRKCSEYGRQMALKLGKIIGNAGLGVISGMAKGIDSFAHLGALRNAGKTVAVLGCGPDICYPSENKKIYEQIAEEGLIISEYEPGMPPRAYGFPQRNRIIAALGQAVVVVEAGNNSGALITAELANELGRPVYALPGNINNPLCLGSNKLIADGVIPLVVLEDLLRDLGVTSVDIDRDQEKLGENEKDVVNLLQTEGEVSMDYLCLMLGKTPVEMMGIVSILEIKGFVAYNFGKIFLAK